MKAIYKIENQITKDIYIGSAVNYSYRKWIHLKRLRANNHHSQILQNSWNKYGEENFTFSIIEQIETNEMLIQREQFYIDTLNPRYNICKIAGSPLGVKHTNEARTNMSIAHKNLTTEQRGHKEDCNCPICNHQSGEENPRFIKREERLCSCGCNTSFICMVTSKKRFISGHNKPQLGRKRTQSHIDKHRISLLKTLKMKKENEK